MKIDINVLEKVVAEVKARGHNEISFINNRQILSRKRDDKYWEEIML